MNVDVILSAYHTCRSYYRLTFPALMKYRYFFSKYLIIVTKSPLVESQS